MRDLRCIDSDFGSVLVRVDYNLPRTESGEIADTTRILDSKKTIDFLRSRGLKVRLLTHWGRPLQSESDWSTQHLVRAVSQVLGEPVVFDPAPLNALWKGHSAPLTLCENVRFYPEESTCSSLFVDLLAARGDCFVFEGFSVAHRAHASVVGLQNSLPTYLGLSCQQEWQMVQELDSLIEGGILVLGGSKIETKLPCLEALLPRVSCVMLGGLMAFAYMRMLRDEDFRLNAVKPYLHKILCPEDVVTCLGVKPMEDCSAEEIIDIGPFTQRHYCNRIMRGTSFFVNGPLGYYENADGREGTHAIARALSAVSQKSDFVYGLVGGGDTVAALGGHLEYTNFQCSTAGGAVLQALATKSLCAIGSFHD